MVNQPSIKEMSFGNTNTIKMYLLLLDVNEMLRFLFCEEEEFEGDIKLS